MSESMRGGPLKLREFQILLLLGDGPRHGWSLVKELQAQADDGVRVLPGSLYRTLNQMLEQGLIDEAPEEATGDDGRRRYLRLTEAGIQVAQAEAERLQELLRLAHSKGVFFPHGATA